MKISMWMIVDKLQKYDPKFSIVDGTACITGVRFISWDAEKEFLPEYVYLSIDQDAPYPYDQGESAVLCNGRDMILLRGRDVNEILNDLLAVFDFYNNWEKSLWEASAHKSFQQIIDLGDAVLENPMMVADMDGNVLAMSSSFVDEDINEYWVESRTSRRVPTAILGAPMHTLDGALSSWTDTPEIYVLPDGTRTIGTYLSNEGDLIAGFGLWEHRKPIDPGDISLVKVLYDVLLSTLEAQQRSTPVRSGAAILEDLLGGMNVEETLLRNLEQRVLRPWRLIVIGNPFRSDIIYRRNLLQRLQSQEHPCVPLLYGEYVVCLISSEQEQTILDSILGAKEKRYYQAGVSLPFGELRRVSIRYTQTAHMLKAAGETPGIYRGEDHALACMLDLFREPVNRQGLIHPALGTLKQYDAERNSELYETLYQYLIHERSVIRSAQAMHVHKNSMMYRLQRIQSIIGADLEDERTRTYLLLSYLLERT